MKNSILFKASHSILCLYSRLSLTLSAFFSKHFFSEKKKYKKISHVKKILSLVALGGSFSVIINEPLLSMTDESYEESYEESHNNLLAGLIDIETPVDLRTLEVSPEEIGLLFATYHLNEPLWKDTRAPAGRDVLYLLPQKLTAIEYGGLAISLFYNQTNRMPLSVKTMFGDLLEEDDCLPLTTPSGNEACTVGKPPTATNNNKGRGFIRLLKVMIEGALEGSDLDPKKVSSDIVTLFPLIKNMTIQQRQLGLFFQYGIPFGPFMFQIHTPFIISERNFWLSLRDIDTISQIMESYYQGGDFDYNQVIQFKAGPGDTRLKLGLNMLNMTNFALDFGAESILPTSLIFYSHDFRSASQPILAPEPIPRQQFESNMSKVLEGIRDYYIEPRLGNGGHFGLGLFLESKCGLFHDFVQLWSRFSYDLLFKGKEDRLFLLKPTMQVNDNVNDLEPVFNDDLGKSPQEKADILETYVRQYILPSSYRCTVKPGGVFNAVLGASVNYKNWRFTVGYDFYARQGEQIYSLDRPKANLFDVDIEKGIASHVEQHKIFTESLYNWSGKKSNIAFGYGTDVTLLSKNIGNDWTVYLKFVASF